MHIHIAPSAAPHGKRRSAFNRSTDLPPIQVLPFLNVTGPIAIAHRGGTEKHPENTLAAFAHAVGLGFRYLETDVHATSDDVVVAFHDARLDQVTDARGSIRELPWSEVRQARARGEEPLATLAELLETWPEVRVNIDPKSDDVVPGLIGLLEQMDAVDRVCIGSFSGARLGRFRRHFGERLATSASPWEVARIRLASIGISSTGLHRARRQQRGPSANCLQVPVRHYAVPVVDRHFVGEAKRRGMPVHVWTVNERAEMERLLDLGIDGIMTDDPEALRQVFADRGLDLAGNS